MTDDHAEQPTDAAARRLEELLAEHRDPEHAADTEEAAPFDPFAPLPAPPTADTGSESADEAADDALPHAPLFALLRNVETHVGVDRIDRIWIFPPRRLQEGETAVVVVAAYHDVDPDRRRVYAAHYTAREEAPEPRLALDEFGTAPAERVGRMVEEVLDRIKDGPAGAPRSHAIDGRDNRWHSVLHDLAEAHLAEVQANPRLRR